MGHCVDGQRPHDLHHMQEVQRATAIPRADEESRSGTDATHTVETASSRVTLPKHIAPACCHPYLIYRRHGQRSVGLVSVAKRPYSSEATPPFYGRSEEGVVDPYETSHQSRDRGTLWVGSGLAHGNRVSRQKLIKLELPAAASRSHEQIGRAH